MVGMTTHTHQTTPTQYVETHGIHFAYRRFGKAGSAPLVFNMRFIGTMDHWDPRVTDGIAKDREVMRAFRRPAQSKKPPFRISMLCSR